MRVFLIQTGGFVGLPLTYRVDVPALDQQVLELLELRLAAAGTPATPNSAGSTIIRVELDDGSCQELEVPTKDPEPEMAELVQQLRAAATLEAR